MQTLKIFYQFCDNCKILSCKFYLKEGEIKIAMFANFKEYHGNHKKLKSLYDFGGRCLKIRDVCMDFEPYFKVHNLVSVHPKSIILGQMTNLNIIFHVVVSVYRLVKIWNSSQFPDEFRNGQLQARKLRGQVYWLGLGQIDHSSKICLNYSSKLVHSLDQCFTTLLHYIQFLLT